MTNVFEMSTSGGLKSTGACGLPAAAVTDGILRWVRLTGPLSPELPSELPSPGTSGLRIRNVAREQNQEPGGCSQPRVARGSTPPGPGRTAVPHAAGGLHSNHTGHCGGGGIARARPGRERTVQRGTTWVDLSGLLIELLDAAVTGEGLAYLSLRHKFDDLADAVEQNPLQVSPDALLAMRRQVAQLSILTEDQGYGFMELQRHYTKNALSDSSRELLRGLVSDADRGLKLLAQMENRLRDLRQHQSQCLQESTNRRLNMLAILSAMYLPPTLIAGIYGMNVQGIPITKLSNGYFVVMLFSWRAWCWGISGFSTGVAGSSRNKPKSNDSTKAVIC